MNPWDRCEDLILAHGQRIFIIDKHLKELTYSELGQRVEKAAELIEQYIPDGPIAWLGTNNSFHFVAVLACFKANRPLFIFNTDWQPAQINGNLIKTGINNLLYDNSLAMDLQIVQQISDHHSVFSFADDNTLLPSIQVISNKPQNQQQAAPAYSNLLYLPTSGTTSESKWAGHCLNTVLDNMQALANKLEITEDDRIHSILPVFTSNGMTITFLLPFVTGASIFVDEQFSPYTLSGYLNRSANANVTILSLVPSLIQMLNRVTNSLPSNVDGNANIVRFVICGTAVLRREDQAVFEALTSIPVYSNYGLTETLFVASQNQNTRGTRSSGSLLEGVQVQLRQGEVCVGGSYLMKDSPSRAEESNVFHTGDLGFLQEGELYITGRQTDIVNKGGYKINPADLDLFLIQIESVLECFSFGAAAEISGEELYSAIVLQEGERERLIKDLRRYINENLPPYMIPKLLIIDAIPRNSAGKPVKRELIRLISPAEHANPNLKGDAVL
ncbi:class I adenylate-forming enzyme family protein [Paenibacillus piscarius]|uniref:class I adenylate-forming enzyme family protein n=1 Tax=Paenibacillus piscarius TaxID=1089681 RepID=UPI001EE9A0E7|nr:class I adenylate-forming enzyme family protein [Paenibacillus piscarius]